jgi:hypothetical protein
VNDKEFFEKNLTLANEFSKYVVEHPEVAAQIPKGAQVVLLLNDDPEFNKKNIALARDQREEDQPVVFVKIEGLIPERASRLINPQLELASQI